MSVLITHSKYFLSSLHVQEATLTLAYQPVDPNSSLSQVIQHTSLIDGFILQLECVTGSGRPGWVVHMWATRCSGALCL